jgi:hypothetical protein
MPAAKGSARTPLGPIPKIVANFVYASSQGQRTHSARTKILYLDKRLIILKEKKQAGTCKANKDYLGVQRGHWRFLRGVLMVFDIKYP